MSVVVVGAGQAGSSCVAKLRADGYEEQITLIGAELAPPYQRPPLSKKYLLGEMELERLYLRPKEYYSEHNIDLLLGRVVTAIDADAKTITVGEKEMDYDDLVLTTGSEPRRLPAKIGGALDGVYTVRDLQDVDLMAPEFETGKRVLIIGGGYIGLEAAAVAAAKGLDVTLVEMADRILQRVACPETADFFRNLHQSHGVKILEGVGLESLNGEARVSSATLSNGEEIEIDFAIVGVGISPAISLAEMAGVEIENGIKTDAHGRSSNPHIWAAGDCASFPCRGTRIRLESVPNAIDQAELVAQNIMGKSIDYVAKPWFWSDQYDVKLQIAGLSAGYDAIVPRITGSTNSYWYFKGDELLAVDAMNAPRDYMVGKRLIEAGKSPTKEQLADLTLELKSLL